MIVFWALAGGGLLGVIAIVAAAGALSKLFLGGGFSFEHELVRYFVGIAIFAFLPYCQLVQGNISVDIFTSGMSERAKVLMAGFSSLFALAFSILMLRQMSLGMGSYIRFPEITPVLRIPLWTAFPPILVSLGLLLLACLITLYESAGKYRRLAPGGSVS